MLLALLGAGTSDAGAQTEAALSGATSVDARDNHTCARVGNGQARCWSDNDNGQLGNNSLVDSDLPVVVLNNAGSAPLTGVTALAGGRDHTCARLNTGCQRPTRQQQPPERLVAVRRGPAELSPNDPEVLP